MKGPNYPNPRPCWNPLVIIYIALAVFAAMLATPAIAGVGEWAAGVATSTFGWMLANALTSIVAMVLLVVGTFWGGTWWGKCLVRAKMPLGEAVKLVVVIHNARRPNSPGGTAVTDAEKDAVLAQAEAVLRAVVAAFGPGSGKALTPTP